MKKCLIWVMMTVLVLSLSGCTSIKNQSADASTVSPVISTVSTETQNVGKVLFVSGEWAPYSSETLPEKGAAGELVAAICKAAGIDMELRFVPWKRAEQMVASGEAFAAYPYAVTEERQAIYDFSDILFYGCNSFFYYDKNTNTPGGISFEVLSDLKKYRIGVLNGSFVENEFTAEGLTFEKVNTVNSCIQMLHAGRIDLYIDEQVTCYDAIKRLYPDEIKHFKTIPKTYRDRTPNAILASRKYPNAKALLAKFNEGLVAIKANGEYDRIADKYMMAKTQADQ